MPQTKSDGRLRLSLLALLAAPAALALACGDTIENEYHYHYDRDGEGGEAEPRAGAPSEAGQDGGPGGGGAGGDSVGGDSGSGGDGGDGGAEDSGYPGAPVADTSVADLELDLFKTPGNRYWFGVNEQQLKAMNLGDQGGGCPFCAGGLYTPGDSGGANYVDHLWVTTAGPEPQTADYGKVQVRIVGQSSRQPWDPNSIPNLNIDTDEFVKNQRMAGYEHLRFSNGQVGSIFRDRVAYDLYRALEYPAPLVTYAWVQSNVWGPDIQIPYLLVERYKQAFCKRNEAVFGGGCANIWEFASDFGYYQGDGGMWPKDVFPPFPEVPGQAKTVFDAPENCQMGECEASRANELDALMSVTPHAEGYKEALKDYIDWPAYHRFQCLSWLMGTSDDQIHASNNVVVVERADGLFHMLPYSVDISLGLWGTVGLIGNNNLSRGCQADPTCWDDMLNECEDLFNDFVAIKPREMLQSIYDELEEQGMLRRGDPQHYSTIDSYLADRLTNMATELEHYRETGPDGGGGNCKPPMIDCHGICQFECPDQCIPPVDPAPVAGSGPVVMGMAAAGGAPGAGGESGVGGGGPILCPKAADKYAVE